MPLESYAPYERLAQALLPSAIDGDDSSHGLPHLHRVWKNAFLIHAEEGGDGEIIAASVLLHDCVAIEKNSPQRSQASRLAAAKAVEVLATLRWADGPRESVRHAIESHSFSAGIRPESLEARILQDADRLDAIGMVGVARCFYTAGRMGSELYNAGDPTAVGRPLDDARYAIDHFYAKLLRLATGFHTAAGARLAQERHASIERFLDDFLREI